MNQGNGELNLFEIDPFLWITPPFLVIPLISADMFEGLKCFSFDEEVLDDVEIEL